MATQSWSTLDSSWGQFHTPEEALKKKPCHLPYLPLQTILGKPAYSLLDFSRKDININEEMCKIETHTFWIFIHLVSEGDNYIWTKHCRQLFRPTIIPTWIHFAWCVLAAGLLEVLCLELMQSFPIVNGWMGLWDYSFVCLMNNINNGLHLNGIYYNIYIQLSSRFLTTH